ncbi:hypothetical protein BS50DRAFT_316440 [Corynespora cassiicola Philippines]|uniref:Uncharacterized protein n=1 Tax=Corynespora cassiicola Philippines TaxID=1448308 RepID=A0A2T2NYR6_CORCC|nr:hypothetical protein BS50DRAFT_316440 [Corynespora cassiicola Philippines]
MAVKTLIVRNMSGHDQRFQVHGWNKNQDIVVKAHQDHRIQAEDGSSGAIIAVHDGHIGEQAEITKHGYGGNDFIDLSNICGAGGNMIVQQVGDNKTRKGDPRFMQNLDAAWKKASQGTRDGLKNCVHVKDGKVVRIDAIKDFPKLEAFVRTFADGKTYIGVGSWKGSPGNKSDNEQSSAANGSKDILICYNDGDCTPNDHAHASAVTSRSTLSREAQNSEYSKNHDDYEVITNDAKTRTEIFPAEAGGDPSKVSLGASLLTQENGEAANDDTEEAESTQEIFHALAASAKDPGPGINLTNKSKKETEYFFYENYWNGNGTAGANFDKPLKSVKLKPNVSQFVPLKSNFKGRVQRGKELPCTWVEFQLEASDDHGAHGDISLQQGCDGAATIASTDGTNVSNGFIHDVVSGAPAAAIRKKPNGERAIDTTMGNWMGGANKAAIDYLNKVVGQKRAYIVGGTGTPDVASKNKRLAVVMY